MRNLIISASLALFASTPAFGSCSVDRWNFVFGFDTTTSMHLTNGNTCVMKWTMGRGAGTDGVAISTPPKHGSASWNGSVGCPEVHYQSTPGYKGPDEFVFTITGASGKHSGPAHVTVSVEVK